MDRIEAQNFKIYAKLEPILEFLPQLESILGFVH